MHQIRNDFPVPAVPSILMQSGGGFGLLKQSEFGGIKYKIQLKRGEST
jgi:hypothetical protein